MIKKTMTEDGLQELSILGIRSIYLLSTKTHIRSIKMSKRQIGKVD